MDERVIKRLLIILAVSIIAIVLIKVALTKTYSHLNDAVVAKKQAATAKFSTQEPALPAAEIIDTPATSGVGEATTQEVFSASGVSENR